MAKKAVTAEQSLESIMWNCRNALRGTVGGNEKNEVNKIDEGRFHERDLIGRVYEYFLQVFAIDSGTSNEKGEFYTPASIVQLIAELIEPYDGVVYDPCCGSGGMFV